MCDSVVPGPVPPVRMTTFPNPECGGVVASLVVCHPPATRDGIGVRRLVALFSV